MKHFFLYSFIILFTFQICYSQKVIMACGNDLCKVFISNKTVFQRGDNYYQIDTGGNVINKPINIQAVNNPIDFCYDLYHDFLRKEVLNSSGKVIYSNVYGFKSFNNGMYVLYYNDKFKGVDRYKNIFVDNKGNILTTVLEKQFGIKSIPGVSKFGGFKDGLALVKVDNMYGYINRKGILQIKPKYYEASDFNEGLAAVKAYNEFHELKWGFIDTLGNVVLDFKYEKKPNDFHEGLSLIQGGDGFGYMNTNGEIVIPFQYYSASNFANSIASVGTRDNIYKIIDKWGDVIVELKGITLKESFRGNYCVATKNSRYGVIDKTGKVIVDFKYRLLIQSFANNRLYYEIYDDEKDRYEDGFINLQNEKVIIFNNYDEFGIPLKCVSRSPYRYY